MADSVLTKIRKALMYQLGTIKTSNNYLNTIINVYDENISFEDMKQYPSCSVVLLEDVQNKFDQQMSVRIEKHAIYSITVVLESNDPAQAKEDMLQDIEKLIGTNYMLPDSLDACTCTMATVVMSVPFGIKTEKKCGLHIKVDVKYSQLRTDPTRRQ